LRIKLRAANQRVGILIDNLEPALDSSGSFIENHKNYIELLRVLSDSRTNSLTLITSRERLYSSEITLERYLLKNLDLNAWRYIFQKRDIPLEPQQEKAFSSLYDVYGGNAKAMEILSSVIREDYDRSISLYWASYGSDLFIDRDLEDLVSKQFERLKRINSNVYDLLCRMGCYRYQNVQRISMSGLLHLLWDVHPQQQKKVVEILRDRSLVEVKNGEFSLHPVIQAEAISRLRVTDDLKKAHQCAAEFWKQDVLECNIMEEALKAFED
jgi:hypothetical protein